MSHSVTLRSYPECSTGTIFVHVNGEIIEMFAAGINRKRVRWLPKWVPFNVWGDRSMAAVVESLAVAKSFAARVDAASGEQGNLF